MPARNDNGVLLKAILTRRTFKPSAEGQPPPGGCKSNKCKAAGARGSGRAVFMCGSLDCLCVGV